MTTQTITAEVPAAPGLAGQPGQPLRRRIGVRQGLTNGLTLAWRNVIQLKHSP